MADKKQLSPKEIEKKIVDLKIELLKQPMKRKSIKREIARLLTVKRSTKLDEGKPSATSKVAVENK